jgi:RNA recognition motif-containing protein
MTEGVMSDNFQEQNLAERNDDTCSIYVGNVPWKATNEDISLLISSKANVQVKDVRIIKEKGTGRSRGFAFVDIKHKNPSEFVENAPELVLEGRTLTIKYANKREEKINSAVIDRSYIEPGNSL